MASTPTSSVPRHEVNALIRQLQSNQFFNRQLSSICQVNGLKSTGVKADLQRRIIALVQESGLSNDSTRFYQVKQSIVNAIAQRSGPIKPAGRINSDILSGSSSHSDLHIPSVPSMLGQDFQPNSGGGHRPLSAYITGMPLRLSFKKSPFYDIEGPASYVRICETMAQHRNSVSISLKLSDNPLLQHCAVDSSYRVLIFCAGEVTGVQDVAFPHQSELRINGGDFKANLRGLKNKPGSTRPVDVTNALRLRANYPNNIEFTYALTSKKYYLVANICKVHSVSELAALISSRHKIPKESVIMELNKKAQDTDVVATSQVLSLKCPLSYMRLETPCRGFGCTHLQCFDATSYLQLQEQGPQWLCPICNKPTAFEHLAIDEYVKDILERTPKSLEAVIIEPDGQWILKAEPEDAQEPNLRSITAAVNTIFEDDDDLEISEIRSFLGGSFYTPNGQSSSLGTPASSSRATEGTSTTSRVSNGGKRPAPAVIDLTLSSDEEEPVRRPSKRQNTATNGHFEQSRLPYSGNSPVW